MVVWDESSTIRYECPALILCFAQYPTGINMRHVIFLVKRLLTSCQFLEGE